MLIVLKKPILEGDKLNYKELILAQITDLMSIPDLILFLIKALTAIFALFFIYKSVVTRHGLVRAIGVLKGKIGKENGHDPKTFDQVFKGKALIHIWKEYSDTLHPMRVAINEKTPIIEYRSSMPAEMMFTKEALVEGPLFDEFWRHLPGILTGLGIIGTFAGLLSGLGEFNKFPPSEAVNGLKPLLSGVMHAFTVSATAISFAMLVVLFSRLIIGHLNAKVERLCDLIDSLYKSGAGEEYLQRLVESSENSEVHLAQLKDSLVEDLTQLMTNLTERQIVSQFDASKMIGETVGRSISEAIAEPMQRVREVMESTNAGNTTQVNNMMETMLTGFMAKLEDTFGGQINGINEQMQQSMAVMASVQTALQALVDDIKNANENATQQMSDKLASAMQTATDNQQQLTQQMTEFVQDFRTLIENEKRESEEAMTKTVSGLLTEVHNSITSMEESRKTAYTADADRTAFLTTKTNGIVAELSSSVEELLVTVGNQVAKTEESIDAIKSVSLRAIEGMNQGALTMGSAAQKFESAGSSMIKVLDGSTVCGQPTHVARMQQL